MPALYKGFWRAHLGKDGAIISQPESSSSNAPDGPQAILTRRPWLVLAVGLALALTIRWLLWLAGAVPFNSDEAIVGLMARHISAGARPSFFYGQAYMGSLDAWLIAGAFQLLGDSLRSIRLVQIGLYLLFMVTAFGLAWRLYGPAVAGWTALLGAVPPVLVMTYTSATLGGYGEVLVLGNLTLLLGYQTAQSQRASHALLWPLLGLVAGLAFWTLGLAVVYLAPVALIHLVRFDRKRLPVYGLALAGFLAGSCPWWFYNLQQGGAALAVLTSDTPFESVWWQRLVGLLALGLPALLGLRFPWSPEYLPTAWLFGGTLLYAGVFLYLAVALRQAGRPIGLGTLLLLSLVGFFGAGFVGTQFGIDSTGRYLLPLYGPLLIGIGLAMEAAWRWRPAIAVGLVASFMLFNGWGVWRAAASADGLTTQFDPITRFGNQADDELITFLQERGVRAGYSNYWVSFRLAFLTDESILLAPLLPYKADFRYTPRDQRIEGYQAAAAEAQTVVYVTSLHPQLDQRLASEFNAAGVAFQVRQIGPYHVFYDLSRPVPPEALDLSPP